MPSLWPSYSLLFFPTTVLSMMSTTPASNQRQLQALATIISPSTESPLTSRSTLKEPHAIKRVTPTKRPSFPSPSSCTSSSATILPKRLSKIGMSIGPSIPASLIRVILRDGVTHLNLHANQIVYLNIIEDDNGDQYHDHANSRAGKSGELRELNNELCFNGVELQSLKELDVSSNNLGGREETTKMSFATRVIPLPPKGIYENRFYSSSPSNNLLFPKLSNLQHLNLSANDLTSISLSRLFATSSHRQQPTISKCTYASMLTPESSYVLLPNLIRLNLSHNQLEKMPFFITDACPRLESLALLNNQIQSIHEWSHLRLRQQQNPQTQHNNMPSTGSIFGKHLKYLFFQNREGNENPICGMENYRLKVISTLRHLIELDGTEITIEEAECADNYLRETSLDADGEKRRDRLSGRPAVGRKRRYKFTHPCHRDIDSRSSKINYVSGGKTKADLKQDRFKNNLSRNQREDRAVANMSLLKLNQLEDHVRVLTQIAGQQVEATQKILLAGKHNDCDHGGDPEDKEVRVGDYNGDGRCQNYRVSWRKSNDAMGTEKIDTASEAQVQTSFVLNSTYETSTPSSLLSTPQTSSGMASKIVKDYHQHIPKALLMQLAVEKWRTFVSSSKLIESSNERTKWKEKMHCGFEQQLEAERRKHESKFEQLERTLIEKEGKLIHIKNDLTALAQNYEKKLKDNSIVYQKKRRKDIEHVALMAENELQTVHQDYQNRLDQERQRADIALKKCNEARERAKMFNKESSDDVEEIRKALEKEKNKCKALTKQLQSHQHTAAIEMSRAEVNQAKVSLFINQI